MIDLLLDNPIRFIPPGGLQSEWPPVDEWPDAYWAHWLRQHNRYPFLRQWSEADITKYLEVDRQYYGLSFGKGKDLKWFYRPTPIATLYHACKVPNVLFGGAVGGSKSYSARWDAYRHAFLIPEYRGIIMRRTLPELERTHIEDVRHETARFNDYFGEERVHWTEKRYELSFRVHGVGADALLTFGHCQNLGDEERYLGPAYDGFYPDEMATFIKKQITGIAGRLRTKKRRITPTMRGTSNPGGANTLWLKDYFIDKNVSKIRIDNPRYKPEKHHFIQAMLYDNPYYMDPDGSYTEYEDRLFDYDPERRVQLLLGDWDALSGQFFPEFTKTRHVATIDIPPGCRIERWIDWGYDPHYGICKWVAALPNGRLYVFYEWRFNGSSARQKMVASEVAKKIHEMTFREVLPLVKANRVSKTIADPSMWGKDGHTGEDYAETFRRNGVAMIRADNDRVLGWGRLRHWFKAAPDGIPWLMYHPRCETSIRIYPSLVRDKNDPDDIDTDGEDHPADADRYGVMARPTPTKLRNDPIIVPPGSFRDLLNSLQPATVRRAGMVS